MTQPTPTTPVEPPPVPDPVPVPSPWPGPYGSSPPEPATCCPLAAGGDVCDCMAFAAELAAAFANPIHIGAAL